MFRIGDVVGFESADAGYHKYHLCVSNDGHFIYLNSPKPKTFLGDFPIDASHITGVPAHESGQTIISCSKVMKFSQTELSELNAKATGRVTNEVLHDLFFHVEDLDSIPKEVQDAILDGLGDWV